MGIDGPLGRPAVFLDRDGVINRAIIRDGKPYPPQTLAELEILPGVAEAVAGLKASGYEIVVVTNQPDVARGKQTRESVEAINDFLSQELGIEHFRVCYHDDTDNCDCRKPQPGLLLEAADQLGLQLSESFMVGDRWRDVEAGQRAGVKTIWIDYGYDERQPTKYHLRCLSLSEASDSIIKNRLCESSSFS